MCIRDRSEGSAVFTSGDARRRTRRRRSSERRVLSAPGAAGRGRAGRRGCPRGRGGRGKPRRARVNDIAHRGWDGRRARRRREADERAEALGTLTTTTTTTREGCSGARARLERGDANALERRFTIVTVKMHTRERERGTRRSRGGSRLSSSKSSATLARLLVSRFNMIIVPYTRKIVGSVRCV